jgi:hypothetical protein
MTSSLVPPASEPRGHVPRAGIPAVIVSSEPASVAKDLTKLARTWARFFGALRMTDGCAATRRRLRCSV